MDPNLQLIPTMENQMEKNIEHAMETGVIKELCRDPSIQMIATLGPKVCRYFLTLGSMDPRGYKSRNIPYESKDPNNNGGAYVQTPVLPRSGGGC